MTTTQKFSVIWGNETVKYSRDMSRHVLTLRKGINTPALHLDHVQILFRPSHSIDLVEFQPHDSNTKTWRVETAQLMVRIKPGVEHTLYTVPASSTPTYEQTIKQPVKAITYSSALSLVPATAGDEDYWQRTYRPIRDTPVAFDLEGITELEIEIFFPNLLVDESNFRTVPNYRILQVYCEFSLDSSVNHQNVQ